MTIVGSLPFAPLREYRSAASRVPSLQIVSLRTSTSLGSVNGGSAGRSTFWADAEAQFAARTERVRTNSLSKVAITSSLNSRARSYRGPPPRSPWPQLALSGSGRARRPPPVRPTPRPRPLQMSPCAGIRLGLAPLDTGHSAREVAELNGGVRPAQGHEFGVGSTPEVSLIFGF